MDIFLFLQGAGDGEEESEAKREGPLELEIEKGIPRRGGGAGRTGLGGCPPGGMGQNLFFGAQTPTKNRILPKKAKRHLCRHGNPEKEDYSV